MIELIKVKYKIRKFSLFRFFSSTIYILFLGTKGVFNVLGVKGRKVFSSSYH